ncbi:uncharacterized protein METZ01_LOCUS84575 [marine metagenome]|uniref:Uncharacterized protein n=1 Tax=marine metagenome TaxID=408172 RepID=A0A381UVE4_9ZZZZ
MTQFTDGNLPGKKKNRKKNIFTDGNLP